MRGLTYGIVAAAFGLAFAPGVQAQLVEVHGPKVHLGIGGTLARPVGDFQRFVDWGGGINLYSLVALDRERRWGLRVEGSLLVYGHESFDTPLSPTVGRVLVDVDTDNLIFGLGVGPQFTLDLGSVRPYVFGTAGFSYFATVSSAGDDYGGDFASSTNFDDATLALRGGLGMLVALSQGRHPLSLDFSVQSTLNGEAEYLRRGGVRDNADGSITVFPIRSEANLVSFRVGVAIGL